MSIRCRWCGVIWSHLRGYCAIAAGFFGFFACSFVRTTVRQVRGYQIAACARRQRFFSRAAFARSATLRFVNADHRFLLFEFPKRILDAALGQVCNLNESRNGRPREVTVRSCVGCPWRPHFTLDVAVVTKSGKYGSG
jgi:hypothetical protein